MRGAVVYFVLKWHGWMSSYEDRLLGGLKSALQCYFELDINYFINIPSFDKCFFVNRF